MPSDRLNALIVVAKQPSPGNTKTRLSPPLSIDQASALYECFLRDTLDLMRQVEETDRVLAYLPSGAEPYFRNLAPDFQLIVQEGADLGERLDHVLAWHLSHRYQRVVILDSDSPTLPPEYLHTAFSNLADGAEVVLGPTEDGGYYCIGASLPVPRLLREVRMSTPTVFSDTTALARELKLHLVELPRWYDVDNAASLERLAEEVRQTDSRRAAHTRGFLERNPIEELVRKGARQ
jgi:rSAM/selenodomain-associated transferase 1